MTMLIISTRPTNIPKPSFSHNSPPTQNFLHVFLIPNPTTDRTFMSSLAIVNIFHFAPPPPIIFCIKFFRFQDIVGIS